MKVIWGLASEDDPIYSTGLVISSHKSGPGSKLSEMSSQNNTAGQEAATPPPDIGDQLTADEEEGSDSTDQDQERSESSD